MITIHCSGEENERGNAVPLTLEEAAKIVILNHPLNAVLRQVCL